jgi:hypothetical protein
MRPAKLTICERCGSDLKCKYYGKFVEHYECTNYSCDLYLRFFRYTKTHIFKYYSVYFFIGDYRIGYDVVKEKLSITKFQIIPRNSGKPVYRWIKFIIYDLNKKIDPKTFSKDDLEKLIMLAT